MGLFIGNVINWAEKINGNEINKLYWQNFYEERNSKKYVLIYSRARVTGVFLNNDTISNDMSFQKYVWSKLK